jgi:transcriptional regulator with XRE-family HTH domain
VADRLQMIDPDELGARLRERRARSGLSLRAAGAEAGVSYATLSKIEAGHLPDLTTYRRLVAWIDPAPVVDDPEPTGEVAEATIEAVTMHLQRDPALTPDDADRIAMVVRELYSALAQPMSRSAVHLRMATTLHPQAARKLGPLLADIHEALSQTEA